MTFVQDLQDRLEQEEFRTVGSSFGGTGPSAIYSVTSLRNWILENGNNQDSPVQETFSELRDVIDQESFKYLIGSTIRFSFLIELTDLKVGSTKMKTRWLPGLILMPQDGSFAPVRGSFEPGNDPRASSFAECYEVFTSFLEQASHELQSEESRLVLKELSKVRRVPYEIPFGYNDANLDPVHTADNVSWVMSDDLAWLGRARVILNDVDPENRAALREIIKRKLEVKVYKTDRALTGKDKTNRAKRWEVLCGDFQQSTLQQCWSVESALTRALLNFEDFPTNIRQSFVDEQLIGATESVTRCPVTLAPLNYGEFAAAMLEATHGRSDYQIGHLTPLKRAGRHVGDNVCWQSADGNRIQGDLSIDETVAMLEAIEGRRQGLADEQLASLGHVSQTGA